MSIGWNDIDKNKSTDLNIYFKLSRDEKKVKFRPIGDLFTFKKYMFNHEGKWRIAVCLNEDSCPVATKHNIVPSVRYAINVIDRRDNKIKILETSIKVVRQLKVFFEKTGKEPGSANGAEYAMSFIESRGRWVYSAEFCGAHTLSSDDVKLIKENGLYNIKENYKATPPDKIEDILFGDIISQNYSDKTNSVDDKIDNSKFNI